MAESYRKRGHRVTRWPGYPQWPQGAHPRPAPGVSRCWHVAAPSAPCSPHPSPAPLRGRRAGDWHGREASTGPQGQARARPIPGVGRGLIRPLLRARRGQEPGPAGLWHLAPPHPTGPGGWKGLPRSCCAPSWQPAPSSFSQGGKGDKWPNSDKRPPWLLFSPSLAAFMWEQRRCCSCQPARPSQDTRRLLLPPLLPGDLRSLSPQPPASLPVPYAP